MVEVGQIIRLRVGQIHRLNSCNEIVYLLVLFWLCDGRGRPNYQVEGRPDS